MPAVMPPVSSLNENPPAKLALRAVPCAPFDCTNVMAAPAASAMILERSPRSAVRVVDEVFITPRPMGLPATGSPITAWRGRLMVLPVPAPTKAPPKLLERAEDVALRAPAMA